MKRFLSNYRKFPELRLLVLVILLVFSYYSIKQLISGTYFYAAIAHNYAQLLVAILNFVTGADNFSLNAFYITSQNAFYAFAHILVIKYYVLSMLIVFIFPRKLKESLLVYLLSSFIFLLLTVFRILIEQYADDAFTPLLVALIISLRYNLLLALLLYKISLHVSLKTLFEKWSVIIKNTFVFSLNKLLVLIASIPFITALFDWFLVAKWNLLVTLLTRFILVSSNFILSIIGYPEAYSWNKYVFLDNYWLFLDTNCLGVGLMVLFTFLILTVQSPLINRIIFVMLGLLFIVGMNAFRIVSILLYIFKNQIPASKIEDYHTLSNNIFYIVMFFVILLYVFWFQNIKFFSRRK